MKGNYSIISNNGIKSFVKRQKLFEYLKHSIDDNDFIFLQKTHSLMKDKQKWKDDFKGLLLFSHGKINCCAVVNDY